MTRQTKNECAHSFSHCINCARPNKHRKRDGSSQERETTANTIFLANVTIHIYKQIIVNLFPIFTNTIL